MAAKNRIELDGAQQKTAVIAFGGNALLRPQDHGTQEEQFTLSWKATRWLFEIIHRGYELAIIHGNGPQVGNIMIQVEEAITKIPPQSLDVAVAQTQGSMGFMLANQLRNRFNEEQLEKDIATLVTEDAASFAALRAPVQRVCALPVPIPYAPTLEDHVFPDRDRIAGAVRRVMGEGG